MYFVKYGELFLHDPRVDEYSLLDLELTGEENTCNYCDFTIYPSHPMYDKLKERDADNPIEVYDDNILLFSGFIYELGKEFYLDGHVKCKGDLAYLNDSILRPYSTLQKGYGLKAPASVDGYFEWLIGQHNSQVAPNKQFTIGINTSYKLDSNNYLLRENIDYPTVWEEISDKLLKLLGGYIRVRKVNGIRYIDYLAEWTDQNSQMLDFGVNLTDYSQTDNSAGLATFIIPLGARNRETNYTYDDGYFVTSDTSVNSNKKYYTKSNGRYNECNDLITFESGVTYYEYNEYEDESDLPVTLDGVSNLDTKDPDYKIVGDMIFCDSAVQKYGWIGYSEKFQDVKEKAYLVPNGVTSLKKRVSPKRTIEIKAVDMHLINQNVKPIQIGEYVRVRSVPHKLDSYFLCVDIDLDLNNPEDSIYTLGTTYDTLTGQQNKIINELNANVLKQYEMAAKLSDEEKSKAIQIGNITSSIANSQAATDEAICALYEMMIGGQEA